MEPAGDATNLVLGIVIVAVWLAACVVCALKGKWWLATTVLWGLVLAPLLGPFAGLVIIAPMVGALRIARPGSWWEGRYPPEKSARAHVVAGRAPVDRTNVDTAAYRCDACGGHFATEQDALDHADREHLELRFEDAKAAVVRL